MGATRPWFLWDVEIDEPTFRTRLQHPDPSIRAQWQGALLREARFREVFEYLTLAEIVRDLPHIEPHLGRKRAFWHWILEGFRHDGVLPPA